jgi:hypothetical protein
VWLGNQIGTCKKCAKHCNNISTNIMTPILSTHQSCLFWSPVAVGGDSSWPIIRWCESAPQEMPSDLLGINLDETCHHTDMLMPIYFAIFEDVHCQWNGQLCFCPNEAQHGALRRSVVRSFGMSRVSSSGDSTDTIWETAEGAAEDDLAQCLATAQHAQQRWWHGLCWADVRIRIIIQVLRRSNCPRSHAKSVLDLHGILLHVCLIAKATRSHTQRQGMTFGHRECVPDFHFHYVFAIYLVFCALCK